MPQNEAGRRMEPPVSVPKAAQAWSAATAAADPPDEPPGTRSVSQGLRHGVKAEFSFDEPMANSSQLTLPIITAPASLRRCVTVASYGAINCSRIFEPAVERTPWARMTSLSATGIPHSGGGVAPFASVRSAASAWASDSSAHTVRYECKRSSVS